MCFLARASFLRSSERGVCFRVLRSSELSFARASFWVADLKHRVFGSSELFFARAWIFVSGRSSDHVFAWASLFSLNRQQRVFNQFFYFFLFPNPRSDSSLSLHTFYPRFHLVLGCFYPRAFIKKLEGVEGFSLIWIIWVLEHFGVWVSIFVFSFGLFLRGRDLLLQCICFVLSFSILICWG